MAEKMAAGQTPEVLFWVGCAGSFDDRAKKITKAFAKILIEAGADFAELAGKHSQGPSGKRGGELGYFSRGDMAKPFEDAAFALKEPGELSDVIKTRFGYHLIKLEDRREAGLVPFEEVQEKLQEYLQQEKVKEAVQSYVKQLRQEAEIKRFHETESRDG